MTDVSVRFYEELNDFLAPGRRKRTFTLQLAGRTVRDVIEAAGVPCAAVELVLVNGTSVDLAHPVRDGDRVSVYPMFETLDVTPLLRVRPVPLREARFMVAERGLYRLAAYLRLLGFDVWLDGGLAGAAADGGGGPRTLLGHIHPRPSGVSHFCQVRETLPRRQLAELMARLDLARAARPMARCLRCNALLRSTRGGAAGGANEPGSDPQYCPRCGRRLGFERYRRRLAALLRGVCRYADAGS